MFNFIPRQFVSDVELESAAEKISNTLQNFTKIGTYESVTSKEACEEAFTYLNDLRIKNGITALQWDDRAYNLAIARAQDMAARNYYDHVTPEGTCAKDMQAQYGFNSYENVAENLGGMMHDENNNPAPGANIKQVVDGWMSSRGHRYNILYDGHTSGAIGCYKAICLFYGVNSILFGFGSGPCTTGEQGLAFWKSAEKQSGEIT